MIYIKDDSELSGINTYVLNMSKTKKGTIWCWLSTGLVCTKTVIYFNNNNNNNNKHLMLIRRKLTYGYDQMRLTSNELKT